jgi:arginine N-succinyltransferase
MRMLEEEGFHAEGYVDIFDGGPTMTARTDRVRSIATAGAARITHVRAPEGSAVHTRALIATGRLADFRCAYGEIAADGDSGVVVDPLAAQTLGVSAGDTVWHVAR